MQAVWNVVSEAWGWRQLLCHPPATGANRSEMHRLILGVTGQASDLDHLDGFGLNNRRYNLKPTTPRGNMETKKHWRIEQDRRIGLWFVIVRAADGSESRLGPYRSYSEAHNERYEKSDYWSLWQ